MRVHYPVSVEMTTRIPEPSWSALGARRTLLEREGKPARAAPPGGAVLVGLSTSHHGSQREGLEGGCEGHEHQAWESPVLRERVTRGAPTSSEVRRCVLWRENKIGVVLEMGDPSNPNLCSFWKEEHYGLEALGLQTWRSRCPALRKPWRPQSLPLPQPQRPVSVTCARPETGRAARRGEEQPAGIRGTSLRIQHTSPETRTRLSLDESLPQERRVRTKQAPRQNLRNSEDNGQNPEKGELTSREEASERRREPKVGTKPERAQEGSFALKGNE